MGRKSKLTEKQWLEIERRHLDGESIRSLAKEFKVAESTIRERISAQSAQIKKVANQIVETKLELNSMPMSAQISAHNRAQKLLAMQMDLDDAGANGAKTARRISQAVQNIIAKQSDGEIVDGEALKAIMAAGMVTNTHAKLGMDVLSLDVKKPENPTPLEENARLLKDIAAMLPN